MTRRCKRVSPGLAVALQRVSTDNRRQELGAEVQRAAIETWAERERVDVVAWHLDEASGGAPFDRRPGLAAALADVKVHGAGRLVVHRIDRLTRDPIVAALAERELERLGASLVVVEGAGGGSDPTAQLIRSVLVAFGRFERQMIAARIKAALGVKRTRGESTGAPPYGYRVIEGPLRSRRDGEKRPVLTLALDPKEQATKARALELHAQRKSVRRVIAELAAEGRLSRTGKPFTVAAMHAMLND